MYESLDVFEYLDYLRHRWRVVGAACGCAFLLSLSVSLLIPKRYTATASIVIEPPGGNDVRTATAVSPVYLESLRTYERFAASDTLFSLAAERFHLPSTNIESLKQQVLKVSKIRDTKILEISATLTDPKLAQSFVQYLAEQTVELSRGTTQAADRELVEEAQRQLTEAEGRLARAQSAPSEPVEGLQAEVDANVELRSKLRQELIGLQSDVAGYQEQEKQSDGQYARQQLPGMRARAALIEKRADELERSIVAQSAILSRRIAQSDRLQAELKLAQAFHESASARLRDIRAGAGMHGERLRVIDPGIIPERPSSPNIFLNVTAAVFLGLVASIAVLSLGFAYGRRTPGLEPAVSRGRRSG